MARIVENPEQLPAGVAETLGDLDALKLGPNDTLILRPRRPMSMDEVRELKRAWERTYKGPIPANQVVILDHSIEMAVLRGSEE